MALLSLKQETIETFAANATQEAMMVHRRVNQKKNKVLESVPLLKKMKEKITEFDQEMTKRLGKNYTKVRNIAIGVGKFYVAGQFGGPGIIALGAINAARAVKPLLKNAEKERQEGKVSGLFDYIVKNPKEASKTLAAASLGAGAIAFGLSGMLDARFVTRAAATALVVVPEMRALKETVQSIVGGKKTAKEALNDLGRDILTVGISAASFIAGNYGYIAEQTASAENVTEANTTTTPETNTATNAGTGTNTGTEAGGNGVSVGVKSADKTAAGKNASPAAPEDKAEQKKNKEKSLQSALTDIKQKAKDAVFSPTVTQMLKGRDF
ncbi:MAG: hypothetical protein ACI4TE_09665 [Alphaproteobacteria bacterium]